MAFENTGKELMKFLEYQTNFVLKKLNSERAEFLEES